MTKKTVLTILITMLISVGVISLYSTFAYDEEAAKLEDSTADYNLIYSMRETSKNQTSVAPGETKFLDINLRNVYDSTVKYGVYYHLISPKQLSDQVVIGLAEESKDQLEDTINAGEEKAITIRLFNGSEENVELVLGALVGFENGDINELISDGEVLIK